MVNLSEEMKIVYRKINDNVSFTWKKDSAKKEILRYLLGTYLTDNPNFNIIKDYIDVEDMIESNKNNPTFNATKYSLILSNAWEEVKTIKLSELPEETKEYGDLQRSKKSGSISPFFELTKRGRDLSLQELTDPSAKGKILGVKGSEKNLLDEKEQGWDNDSNIGEGFDKYFNDNFEVKTDKYKGQKGPTVRKSFIFRDVMKEKIKKLNAIGFNEIKYVRRQSNLDSSRERVMREGKANQSGGKVQESVKSGKKGSYQLGPDTNDSEKDTSVRDDYLKNKATEIMKLKRKMQLVNSLDKYLNNLVSEGEKGEVEYTGLDLRFDVETNKIIEELELTEEVNRLKEAYALTELEDKTINALSEYLDEGIKSEDSKYKTLENLMDRLQLEADSYNIKENKKLGNEAIDSIYNKVSRAISTSVDAKEKIYINEFEDFSKNLKTISNSLDKEKVEITSQANEQQKDKDTELATAESGKKDALHSEYEDMESAGKKMFSAYINDLDGIYEISYQIERIMAKKYTKKALNDEKKKMMGEDKELSKEDEEKLKAMELETKPVYKLLPVNILLLGTLEINMGPAALELTHQTKEIVSSSGTKLPADDAKNISMAFARIGKRYKKLQTIIGD